MQKASLDHSSLEKVEEVSTKAQEPEVAQAAAEAASAQDAIGAAASAGSEATEAAEVLAHPSPASIEGSETSSIAHAAVVSEVPAKDVGSAEASLLEAAPKSGTSDSSLNRCGTGCGDAHRLSRNQYER